MNAIDYTNRNILESAFILITNDFNINGIDGIFRLDNFILRIFKRTFSCNQTLRNILPV